MALTPINFIKSDSATATNGSDTITVTGNVDCSWIYKASMVFLGTRQMVQAVSGTKPDGSGNSTIKLKEEWADPDTTAKLVVANSIEELASAKKVMVEFFGMLGDAMASGSGTLYFDGTGFTLKSFDPATLGTAATRNVVTSATDVTDGRVIRIFGGGEGWMGLGGGCIDFDQADPPEYNGFFMADYEVTGVGGIGSANHSILQWGNGSSRRTQLIVPGSGDASLDIHVKQYDSDKNVVGIAEMYHKENLIYAQNDSGSTVSSNSVVAGSDMIPSKSGSWRNISGNDIAQSGYGLWQPA